MKAVEGEKLSLTGVLRSDMGGYLCIATNGIPPSVSKRYHVQVNCKWIKLLLRLIDDERCCSLLRVFMMITGKINDKGQAN